MKTFKIKVYYYKMLSIKSVASDVHEYINSYTELHHLAPSDMVVEGWSVASHGPILTLGINT